MNGDELTDVFQRILPAQPSTRGWAGRARRRSQQRRAIAGAAAVAVVAALAIPFGLHLDAGPQVMTTPAPTITAQQLEDGGPTACQEAARAHFDGATPVDGKLPEGATRLWLCGNGFPGTDSRDQLSFVGPQDVLTVGVEEAVDAFNALTWQEGAAIDCASNGEVYHVLVEYPDRATQTLTGYFTPDGCQHFDTSGGIVDGADEYLETLQGLWEAQRGSAEPERLEINMCPGSTSLFSLNPDDLLRGLGCVVQRENTTTATTVTASSDDLPADLLTLVRDEVAAGGEPLGRFEAFSTDQQIILLTPSNDPLALLWGTWGKGPGLTWNNPERRVWYPDAAQAQRLEEYFAQLPQSIDAEPEPTLGSEDTDGLTSKVCADIQSGKVAPDFLDGADNLPAGAERVWMCGDLNDPFGGPLGPREPLVTDPDRVIEAINALEPGPKGDVACTAMGGLTFYLAIDYPDGDRKVISAETVNCSFVGGGRIGGGQLLQEIQPMWADQRASMGPPPTLGDPQVCDTFPGPAQLEAGYTSILDVALGDAVWGAACGLSKDANDFDGEVLQRSLPAEVVNAIADASTSVEPNYFPATPGLPYFVLLNRFGDPTTVQLTSGGDILLPDGPWTPDDATATLLEDTLRGVRTKPFYEEPADCSKYVEGEKSADLADVTSGAACVQASAIPAKGPELEAGFAQELARRFAAESVPMSWGAKSSHVVLRDDDGRRLNLYYDNRNHFDAALTAGLTNEAGDRVWELPDDVRAELELYGFDFAQQ